MGVYAQKSRRLHLLVVHNFMKVKMASWLNDSDDLVQGMDTPLPSITSNPSPAIDKILKCNTQQLPALLALVMSSNVPLSNRRLLHYLDPPLPIFMSKFMAQSCPHKADCTCGNLDFSLTSSPHTK